MPDIGGAEMDQGWIWRFAVLVFQFLLVYDIPYDLHI
jgi:hypothetical protein